RRLRRQFRGSSARFATRLAEGRAMAAAADRGAWLELSGEAAVEGVAAVSGIPGRVAPGGTTIEPASELVDEGLGARVDPSRPSVVRAYVPARDAGAAER